MDSQMERMNAIFALANEIDQLRNPDPSATTTIVEESEFDLVELELQPIVFVGSAIVNGRELIACIRKYKTGIVNAVVTFDDGYFDQVSSTSLHSSIEEALLKIEDVTLRLLLWY